MLGLFATKKKEMSAGLFPTHQQRVRVVEGRQSELSRHPLPSSPECVSCHLPVQVVNGVAVAAALRKGDAVVQAGDVALLGVEDKYLPGFFFAKLN